MTCAGTFPRAGPRQAETSPIPDGALAASQGRIVYTGPSQRVREAVTPGPGARIVDLRGRYSIVPGLIDPHTHAVFAGDRRGELTARLSGATYAQIAAAGGGILSTVTATRQASLHELINDTRMRLDEMLACGTTTCEIKSGYGLTIASELKMLEAIRALRRTHPLHIVSTFMGAHEIPPEYTGAREKYVDLIVNGMIPAVAEAGLAEWCDVFCEEGVFTPAESLRILRAGREKGLQARIHADELKSSGGSEVAAAVGARSADHLVFVSPEHIRLLAAAGVTATLLPATAFYLKLGRYAPARALIDAGVPVALATDVNPGGGLSPSLPFAMALACFCMDMTFEEALVAATVNAAWCLDRGATIGSLEPGKLADLLMLEGDPVELLRIGTTSITAVMKSGKPVHGVLPRGVKEGTE